MKLKTSFFNPTVLKKDLTRFAPLWGVYTVLMLLFLMLLGASEDTPGQIATTVPYILYGMGILNFIYAGLAAMCLFFDLYQSRMANMLHALPMRREGWFLTHACAGLLFCLVPNLLGTLIAAFMTGPYCWAALIWLGVTVLEYLVFFGIGVFCMLCAGNLLGAVAMYALVNFLAPLGAFLFSLFYQPALYGVEPDIERICMLSPVVKLSGVQFLEMEYDNMHETATVTAVYGEAWLYLGIAAAVGVALAAIALLIYRKRHMESAGEMIAWKPAAPVLLVIYSLLAASMFYGLAMLFSEELELGFLLVGLALGFFISKMLLEKRVKVFHRKNLLAFAVFVGVFLGSLALTAWDPLGITRYVPDTDQVVSVSVSPYNSGYSIEHQGAVLTEPQDIDIVLRLHQKAIDNRPAEEYTSLSLHLRYKLKSGREVMRTYYLEDTTEDRETLKKLYSRPENILGYATPEELFRDLRQINLYYFDESNPYTALLISNYRVPSIYVDKWDNFYIEQLEGSLANSKVTAEFIDLLFADCADGNTCDWNNGGDTIGQLELIVEANGVQESIYVPVNSNCANILGYLRKLEPTPIEQ